MFLCWESVFMKILLSLVFFSRFAVLFTVIITTFSVSSFRVISFSVINVIHNNFGMIIAKLLLVKVQ